MTFFKRVIGIIVNPKETLAEISNSKPVWQAIAINVVLGLISVLITFNKNVLFNDMGAGLSPYDLDIIYSVVPMFTMMGIFFAMIVNPLMHFVVTGVYHLIADFLGHEGNGKGLFAALGFASIPGIFSTIINAILYTFEVPFLGIIVTLSITAWIIVLYIIAIKATYKMSTGKATLSGFLPIIAMIVVSGIFIVLWIISFIPIYTKIVGPFMY